MKASFKFSASFFFIIFLIIFISSQISKVYSQGSSTDSCNTNLKLKSEILFDTTSFHCLTVWNQQDYILRVQFPSLLLSEIANFRSQISASFFFSSDISLTFSLFQVYENRYKCMELCSLSTKHKFVYCYGIFRKGKNGWLNCNCWMGL